MRFFARLTIFVLLRCKGQLKGKKRPRRVNSIIHQTIYYPFHNHVYIHLYYSKIFHIYFEKLKTLKIQMLRLRDKHSKKLHPWL